MFLLTEGKSEKGSGFFENEGVVWGFLVLSSSFYFDFDDGLGLKFPATI